MKELPTIEIIGAGVGGNKVPDLQARIEKDVLAKKPTIVVVYIGHKRCMAFYYTRPGRHTER